MEQKSWLQAYQKVGYRLKPLLNSSLTANTIYLLLRTVTLALFTKQRFVMRMPFIEFITSGDLKFILVFLVFFAIASFHFIKKFQANSDPLLIAYHNSKINSAAFWILISGVLSLLLGLMHSFYFIGKAGGIAPNLIFQGVSTALITPVLGISLFILCKIFSGLFNLKMTKA